MSIGESSPHVGSVRRTSAKERLARMPSAQDILNRPNRDTAFMRYAPSEDPLDSPRVIDDDTPFTKADSGILSQQPLPAGEAFGGNVGQWMSQAEIEAYVLEAERGALAEIRASQGLPKRHELEFRYTGPDVRINLTASEGSDGERIEQILSALSGRALQSQPQLSQYPIEDATYAPTPARFPAYGTPAAIEAPQRPFITDSLVDTPEADYPEKMSFMRKHRKGLAKAALIGTMYFWFRPVGNVFYEIGKQGVNGEIASISELALAFQGKEVPSGDDS